MPPDAVVKMKKGRSSNLGGKINSVLGVSFKGDPGPESLLLRDFPELEQLPQLDDAVDVKLLCLKRIRCFPSDAKR